MGVLEVEITNLLFVVYFLTKLGYHMTNRTLSVSNHVTFLNGMILRPVSDYTSVWDL